MRAGDLDRSVTIQSATSAQDAVGQPIQTWSDVATGIAAKVSPMRGAETFNNSQPIGYMTATFRIRYRTGITVENRVVYNGRNWDILDVRELGRREGIEIDARTRAE